MREALQHVDRRAGRRRVDVELEDELLMADMDARLIVQVIINLVNNAVSYTPADGRIVVSARRVVEHDRPRVRIAVADEGPGISEEDRKHIFDMFYNGSTGRAERAAISSAAWAWACRYAVPSSKCTAAL